VVILKLKPRKSVLAMLILSMCLALSLPSVPVPAVHGISTSQWSQWASIAWRYYQPSVGVNANTGISQAKLDWPYATDWDLGGYIVATIHARRLGLVGYGGPWGFSDRINRVLQFLENRQLGTYGSVSGWPYWAYSSVDRSPLVTGFTNWSDHGRLLYALDMLRKYDPSTDARVSGIIQRSKAASDVMAGQVPINYYGYVVAQGYAAFGYDESAVISGFENWGGGYVDVEGISLPAVETTSEPILHGILELELGGRFFELATSVFGAQRARWVRTGGLTAWSEGLYNPSPTYIYEWVVDSEVPHRPWVIRSAADWSELSILPLMYVKVAFGFMAIFGEDSYTSGLVAAASSLIHSSYGFGEATFENGQSAITLWGSETRGFYTDKTNQLIIAAAFYVCAMNTPLSTIRSLVVDAESFSAYVVLPDYGRGVESPSHVPKPKIVLPALVTDIFASAYVLGSFKNGQYEVLDTSEYVSSSGRPNFPASYPVLSFASLWVNALVYYYDRSDQSLVYLTFQAGTEHTIIHRSTGRILATLSDAQKNAGMTDYFVIQAFKDTDGRPVFLLWGVGWKGTYAAAVYFVRYMLPNIDTYTSGWYLYKWDEATSGQSFNSIPDAGDTYTLIDSGF